MPRCLLPLLGLLASCGSNSASQHPNVILITLDTTRPDYLSCYESRRAPTPALDALASKGVLFEAALATSGVTPVSHASILTGEYQYRHGLRVLSAGSGFRLPPGQATIAGTLRDKGYSTAAVHSAFPVSGHFGFARDYDHFDSFDGALEWSDPTGQDKTKWDSKLQRRSDETVDRVLSALDQGASQGAPVFMWIHLWDPHDPNIKPPREYWNHLAEQMGQPTAANSALYEQFYATEVRFMDQQIGRLLGGLEERGLAESTLVAVTADHGEGLSDGYARHGWGKHRMTYQEQLHVPLIIAGPGVSPGVVSDMVSTVDIVPTLLELAGFSGEGYGGRSLKPLMEGEPLPPKNAYADQVNGYDWNASMVGARPDAAFLYTVCDGEWKLIYRPHMHEATELFNLVQDPLEEHNVLAENRAVYVRLLTDLAHRSPWVVEDFEITGEGDAGAQAALQGLGYTGGDEDEDDAPTRNLTWWWHCPEHDDYRRDSRRASDGTEQHAEDGCKLPVVPRTQWPPQ